MIPRAFAIVAAVLMSSVLSRAQTPLTPAEQAFQDRYLHTDELPAIPFVPKDADPIKEHESDHATVIFRVTKGCWTSDRMVLAAWKDEGVQRWVKDQGRVWLASAEGPLAKRPPSLVRLIGRDPPDGMYAFRDGKVIDHDIDFDDGAELLAWLKYVDAGIVPREFAQKRAGPRDDSLRLAPHIVCARRMEIAGDQEAAADEYLWVVEQFYRHQARDGTIDRIRTIPMLYRIGGYAMIQYGVLDRASTLGAEYPATRTRWIALRDELVAIASDPSKAGYNAGEAAREITLFTPDVEGTFALLDKYKDNKRITAMIESLLPELVASMGSGEQWERAGKLIRDPSVHVRRQMVKLDVLEGLNDASEPVSKASPQTYRPIELRCAQSVAIVYAALLAAGREKEAREAADEAFKLHDSPTLRACLVLTALDAGQPREEHRAWAKTGEASWLFEKSLPKKTLSELVDEALPKAKPDK